ITSWGSTGSGVGQFRTPLGLSVNASGFVYVVDQGNQRVQIFRNNGTYVGSFGGLGTTPGKFLSPYGVAVDSLGFVYVSDSASMSDNVTKFTKTGGFVLTWGGLNSGGTLAAPTMMAVDNASNIYVSDNFWNNIQKFSTSSGSLISSWGTAGASPGQFNGPIGVAIDSQLNLYVGDSKNFFQTALLAEHGVPLEPETDNSSIHTGSRLTVQTTST